MSKVFAVGKVVRGRVVFEKVLNHGKEGCYATKEL